MNERERIVQAKTAAEFLRWYAKCLNKRKVRPWSSIQTLEDAWCECEGFIKFDRRGEERE